MNEKIAWSDRIRQRTVGAGADIATLWNHTSKPEAVHRLQQHLREIDNVANEMMLAGQKEFLASRDGEDVAEELEKLQQEMKDRGFNVG